MEWKLHEWNRLYASGGSLPPMTDKEVDNAITQLRSSDYPAPTDCPEEYCPDYRPSCLLGVCKIAVCMCGDF